MIRNEFFFKKKQNQWASLVGNKMKVQGLTHIYLKPKTKAIAYWESSRKKKIKRVCLALYKIVVKWSIKQARTSFNVDIKQRTLWKSYVQNKKNTKNKIKEKKYLHLFSFNIAFLPWLWIKTMFLCKGIIYLCSHFYFQQSLSLPWYKISFQTKP